MPSDQTRKLLKLFGVAMTTLEEKVQQGAAGEELARAEAEVNIRFQEIAALIDRWRTTMPRRDTASH